MGSNNRTEIHLGNSESKIDVFKNIFCLLYFSGVFENKYDKVKQSNISVSVVITGKFIFNIFIFLHFFIRTSSYILSMEDDVKLKITNIFMDVLSVLNRIYLQKKFKQLQKLAKVVYEHRCFKVRKTI